MTRVVCITGSSSGIGKSIGDYLTTRGYRVIGSSRNPEKHPNTAFPLLSLDVRDSESVNQFVATVLAQEKRIDVLINNAGVGITGPAEEIPENEIQGVFETNFYGPIRMIKAVLPAMRKQNTGLIINITSIAGYMGLPFRSYYSASKSALEITSEAMRMELKPFCIEMTCVAPGDFATNIAAGRYHAPVKPDSYYPAYAKSLELMNAHVDSGENPEKMAKAILKIIQTQKPKVSYRIGNQLQKFSLILKKLLPSKVYEKILMKHYKL